MKAANIFILFSLLAAAVVLLVFILGTLLEWYHRHKLLARILLIGLVLALFAYGFSVRK